MRIRRIFVLMCLLLTIFTLLLGRAFYYQIVRGEEIVKRATAMRSKSITLKEVSRGSILDRNHLPLTDNYNSLALYALPEEIIKAYQAEKLDEDTRKHIFYNLALTLERNVENINKREVIDKLNNAIEKGEPLIRLLPKLTPGNIEKVKELNISGLVIAPVINRYEPNGFCQHILGYFTGSEKIIGVAGIEKRYDDILGHNSASPQLVSIADARGEAIQGLMFKVKESNTTNRGTVVLTIDKRMQQIVEEVVNNKMQKGAVVLMDVKNKEILAVASRPTFNPYDLPNIIGRQDSPLTNRAMSRYYPGSLFKILVTAAALEERQVSLEEEFTCNGVFKFTEELSTSCWKKEGHGKVSFTQAFAHSCNPVFIEIGLRLKRNKLEEYIEKFHLNDVTINGWKNGSEKDSFLKVRPGPAGVGNACLGQEGIMLTPVAITNLIATIADDGKWRRPSITKYTIDKNGEEVFTRNHQPRQVISAETAKKVQFLMEEVVLTGTGKTASLANVKIAGKTATSQTGSYQDDEEILNTWFGGYFPADNPKWALVVLVEAGTSGAADAAPLFREIAEGILSLFSTVN